MDLRTARFLRDRMSQWELSKRSGVSQSRISLAENNLIELTVGEMLAIAKALGVQKDQLDWPWKEKR